MNSPSNLSGQQPPQQKHQYPLLQSRQIRLLHVHSDISTSRNIVASYRVASLDDCPKFKALSYCWGDPKPTHQISLSNSTLSITETLHQFLVRSLELGFAENFLWIDAICIDQKNPSERGHQVKLMGEVYSKAEEVIIWLGESTDTSWMAFDLIKHLGEMFESSSVSFSVEKLNEQNWTRAKSLCWVETGRLMQRPWFSRIWVVQEIVLSQKALVVCGKDNLKWNKLAVFVEMAHKWNLYYYAVPAAITGPFSVVGWTTIRNIESDRTNLHKGKWLTMEFMLDYCYRTLATDPRDKIFGILGLCADSDEFVKEPDYNCSTAELYSDVTRRLCLRYNSVYSLSMAGVGWQQRTLELPSWTPDYSRNSLGWGFDGSFSTATQETVHVSSDNSNTICLKGIILDEVLQLSLCGGSSSGTDIVEWYLQTEAQFFQSGIKEIEFFEALCTKDDKHRIFISSEYFQAFVAIMVSAWKSHRDYEIDLYEDSIGQKAMVIWNNMEDVCKEKRMFSTTQSRVGICPPLARIGDVLFVPLGGEVPFLIRPLPGESASANQRYQLVGSCYVSGIMKGEALELGLEEQEIILV